MVTIKASYGTQSTAKVISAWPRLSSKGTTTYEIQLHADGVLTCNCPGWVNRGSRDCKHVKGLLFKANSIIRGDSKPEFENSGGISVVSILHEKVKKLETSVSSIKKPRFLQLMEEGD